MQLPRLSQLTINATITNGIWNQTLQLKILYKYRLVAGEIITHGCSIAVFGYRKVLKVRITLMNGDYLGLYGILI
jgi:hypothetical protein